MGKAMIREKTRVYYRCGVKGCNESGSYDRDDLIKHFLNNHIKREIEYE